MKIGQVCNRLVACIGPGDTVQQAAERMRQHHVGDLVVTRIDGENQHPLGIVTDRDIVVEVVAAGIDPASLAVADIMGNHLLVAYEEDDVSEALELMEQRHIRRLPVVSTDGVLVGILALDDVLQLMATDLGAMAAIVGTQRREESRARS